MDINGQAAIVTGAASGLGAATARALAAAGAKVAVLDVNEQAALKVAGAIGGLVAPCDVASSEDVTAALRSAASVHGPARILVNCAGIGPAKRIVGRDGPAPLSEFERVIRVNLVGTYNCLRLAALTMPAAREFAQFGIRVLAIAPGIFRTPMVHALPQEAQDSLGASVPFPKRLGEPEEFAELVLHMVRNRYLNGELIRLDGALRMAPR